MELRGKLVLADGTAAAEAQENQALHRCRPAWFPYRIPRPAPAPPFSDQFPPQHRPSPDSPPRVAFRPHGRYRKLIDVTSVTTPPTVAEGLQRPW